MFEFIRRILGAPPADEGKLSVDELARRLNLSVDALRTIRVDYHEFRIPKRTGGTRKILAPSPELKQVQRTILRRLLSRLKAHPCATGFERGHSIVTNALPHVGKHVVIRLDIKDFFGSTSARRVEEYFRHIGWERKAAELLTKLCTFDDALPQGAPTSPRLSNLLNYLMDVRIAALVAEFGGNYSRYADDITISFPDAVRRNEIIYLVKEIIWDEGAYRLHTDKKLRIARRHDRQLVTGIVVNERPSLPRMTRRWLRAVEHRMKTRGSATISQQQLNGWRALQRMVEDQSRRPEST